MTDIVERLRERAAERQRDGWELSDAMTPREMIDIAREIDRLRADNERLRAALREVADAYEWWGEDQYDRDQGVVGDAIFAARRALEGKDAS